MTISRRSRAEVVELRQSLRAARRAAHDRVVRGQRAVGRRERELGVAAGDRSPRRVRLTEEGAAVLPSPRAVLAAGKYARARVGERLVDRGVVLRIGAGKGMVERLDRLLVLLEATGAE